MIPSNLHFDSPNPNIPFEQLRLRVAQKLEPWPVNGSTARLAGINSFGFGGTNAHVILDAPPPQRARNIGEPAVDTQASRDLILRLGSCCKLYPTWNPGIAI